MSKCITVQVHHSYESSKRNTLVRLFIASISPLRFGGDGRRVLIWSLSSRRTTGGRLERIDCPALEERRCKVITWIKAEDEMVG